MRDQLKARVSVLTVVFCAGFAAVGLRAGCLQLVPNPKLAKISKQQSHREIEIPSTRGDIVDRHGKLLAGSVDVFSIYADPRSIDPNLARSYAETLSGVLDEPFSKLYPRLVSDRAFVWLSRQRSPRIRDEVKALKLEGVAIRKEPKRYYPERDLASHVLGFTNVDGQGLEGIERRFDEVLAGAPKSVDVMRDALGHYLLFDQAARDTTVKGDTVRLTLDSAIQHAAQAAIRDALTR
ncbi:MAG: penicillin-binding protein, partial [Myxococcota bacterium]